MKTILRKKVGENFYSKIFGLIVIVCIFLLSLFNTNKIVKNSEKENLQKVSELYQSIDKKLNFLNITLYEMKTNQQFKEYFYENSSISEKRYRRIKLFEYLKKTNTIYDRLGFSIEFFTKEENLVFSNLGVIDKSEYLKRNNLPNNIEDSKNFISKVNDKIIFVFSQENFNKTNDIYWVISFDKETFFSEIYFELDNWYITSGEDIINLGKKDIFPETSPDKITKFKISYFDGNFMYISPKIDKLEVFSYELFKLILIAGILYLLGFLFKIFIITPIRNLAIKIGYSGKSIKQEVKFIEQKMEEITLTNKNLEFKIMDMKLYQNSKKIKEFLIGLTNVDSIQEIVQDTPILNLKKYRVIILEIFDIEVTDNIYDKINISKEFVSKYFGQEVIYEIVDIDYKSIAIILEDTLEEEDLKEVMVCLANHCERNFELTFSIAITKTYTQISDMPKAYKEAKKILDYKFAFKQKRVIFLKDLDESQTKKYYYPIDVEAKLITKTLNANEIGVRRILDEIFDENNTAGIDKKQLKEFGGLLYNTLGRIFIQLKEMNQDIDIKFFNAEEILRVNDLNILKEKFEEKVLDICKLTKDKDESDNSDIKNKIEKYLEENYQIDISLDNLADYLGHSFKYTSILFKKVMGDNFKNYLNIYRIEKAKEIMANNKDMKIKDLAEKVGYNSSNTFIRIFRKYEGVSPGKYFGLSDSEEKE